MRGSIPCRSTFIILCLAIFPKLYLSTDLSMIMNMLNHNTFRMKNLEGDMKSMKNSLATLINEVRTMKNTMNHKITSIEKIVSVVNVSMESQGCEDPGRVFIPKSCGKSTIFVDGIDTSLHGRGFNIAVVNKISGKFESVGTFDTCGNPNASGEMKRFIDKIKDGKIVLVVAQDDGFERLTDEGKTALELLGAINPGSIGYRGSFAFVGVKGQVRRKWVWQVLNTRGRGPSKLKASIPLYRD